VSYTLGDIPRLNSIKRLALYLLFAVILAPICGAFVAAFGLRGNYWLLLRISLLAEALALLILTPAILGWVNTVLGRKSKSVAYKIEAVALISGLVALGYFSFVASAGASPVLLYSLVPFLLWSALRFGTTGIASSMLVVAFFSIWGAVHGRGPFNGSTALSSVVSLQLFLLFATIPFMFLAALTEERKEAEKALRQSEERFHLAAQAGKMFAYDWDATTDVMICSEEAAQVLEIDEVGPTTGRKILVKVHPDDRDLFIASVAERNVENPDTQIRYRMLRPDGSIVWVEKTTHAFFDEQGKLVRMIGMVADINERKLAEDKLREYERAVEGSEEMIAVVDREYRYLIANRKLLNMHKMTKEQVMGHSAREVLNQGVFDAVVKEKLDECFQAKVVRYEMKYRYAELGERDVSVSCFPVEGATGVDRVAFIMQDITDRKQVEEVLAGISRRLIEAQEQERRRIARELHDDIGQRLSLLIVELDQLQRNSRDLSAQIRSSAGALKQKASEIVSDIQSLSHKLHSSKLQYLGITAAVRSFCREFGEQQNVEIDVNAHDLPSRLPPDIALCLFRVLQEALHNSAKHSGVRHFGVRLWLSSDEVHLAVSDSGAGFDIKTVMKGRGLGLTSMRERVRLVSGTIVIESMPTAGTTIHVCVPFKSEPGSARAAG
jgi:PAS domain S-box-containing protein